MSNKRIVEIDANGLCCHEFEYTGPDDPQLAASHLDVTSRTDGPFLGKIYNRVDDTWSDPPPPPEEQEEKRPGPRQSAG